MDLNPGVSGEDSGVMAEDHKVSSPKPDNLHTSPCSISRYQKLLISLTKSLRMNTKGVCSGSLVSNHEYLQAHLILILLILCVRFFILTKNLKMNTKGISIEWYMEMLVCALGAWSGINCRNHKYLQAHFTCKYQNQLSAV